MDWMKKFWNLLRIDQGIGKVFKSRYRKFLHKDMITMLLADKDPMHMVDILRACAWIGKAWNSLNNDDTVHRYA